MPSILPLQGNVASVAAEQGGETLGAFGRNHRVVTPGQNQNGRFEWPRRMRWFQRNHRAEQDGAGENSRP